MARKARVEFEGAVYHILDRGDRREAIFGDDADRERFSHVRRGVRADGIRAGFFSRAWRSLGFAKKIWRF